MIRSVVREAWADHPAKVIAAFVATVLFVPVAWFLLVVFLVSMGVPE